jgi:glucose-1-phosphate adenylyltransferase
VLDRGVKIPAGLVVGEDPELDASRFRRTESGICLITQDMLDRAGLIYE